MLNLLLALTFIDHLRKDKVDCYDFWSLNKDVCLHLLCVLIDNMGWEIDFLTVRGDSFFFFCYERVYV